MELNVQEDIQRHLEVLPLHIFSRVILELLIKLPVLFQNFFRCRYFFQFSFLAFDRRKDGEPRNSLGIFRDCHFSNVDLESRVHVQTFKVEINSKFRERIQSFTCFVCRCVLSPLVRCCWPENIRVELRKLAAETLSRNFTVTMETLNRKRTSASQLRSIQSYCKQWVLEILTEYWGYF